MWNGTSGSITESAACSVVERVRVRVAAVGDRVEVGEVDHRPHPRDARRDRDHVLEAAQLAHTTHHLDAERDVAPLRREPLPQLAELVDDRGDRGIALPAEQEARMEDDRRGAARAREPGRVIEHPDGHPQLLAALGVADEGRDRRVDRQRDAGVGGDRAQAGRVVPVHPEAALEVDLARAVAALQEQLDGVLRSLMRRDERRVEADGAHAGSVATDAGERSPRRRAPAAG
jgi:hypothetical protein